MNIPDEVLMVAAQQLWDIESTGPDKAWDDLATSFRASLMTQVEAAAQPIAEWARKETLREAVDAVEDSDPDCYHAFGMGGHDDSCGREAALVAIRALAEGEGQ
ncbi:hypothetical protein IT072_13805 [Leifsonia sp. ZF2019]|uniref:hypothetical protein n=1 Tax=Leifsonia sp. ZF2019 TaxID=2781978 RepID=UPI001CC03A85|nr:hypothetical protein [Leifsonia sp. ZF2019]UAJ78333.1 hypothetical protein IT072_13805 [Leifsonia sp. ZF2019]